MDQGHRQDQGIRGLDIAGDDGDDPPRPTAHAEPLEGINPSFALTMHAARSDLNEMRQTRGRLQRPVFVLSGLMDSGLSKFWAADLRKLIVEEQAGMVIPVTFASHLSAPEGESPWWLPVPTLRLAHLGAMADPRFLAEIARHLRSEKSEATMSRTPVPR